MSADTMDVLPPEKMLEGLHSPPDSNPAHKDDTDSELSDLEPDSKDTIPDLVIEPAEYSEGGVPVFKPTMDEFKDFQRYMDGVNPYGMRTGIVKVIPPPEWVAAQPRLDEAVKTIRVKEPIKQDIMGTAGTYRQANIVHQRSYNLPQWRQLCNQSEHQPPAKRGEKRMGQAPPTKNGPKRSHKAKGGAKSKKGVKKDTKSRDGTVEMVATPDRLPTPESPTIKDEDEELGKAEPCDDDEPAVKRMGGRQPKAISTSARRKNNRRETGHVDEAAFVGFKYELEGDDFSKERCEELERNYWKTLTYAPPLYGADMPGSLFTEKTDSWNLGKLDNLLDVLGTKIPGVNTAYLYLGMWKATFAWHLEDVDLYSINYLHFGAPKQWYSISQGDARRFEAAMKSIWPTDAKACDQFLRHKTFLISPAHLLSNFNIKVNKIVHHPGEFVITFPYGYHSGYNLGYNCAEAVNFALDSWMEYGRVAKKCDCSEAQDSVWIDIHEIERKLRGEETDYDETDEEEVGEEEDTKPTDIPTPPESVGDVKAPPKSAPKKKRKRPTNEKIDKSSIKRIRVRIRAPAKEPCILCPNDIPSEPLLPTEDGQKAHRLCAQYIPETSIEAGAEELVTDVKYINKARLDLKCNYCRSKKGACFQCSQKKCTRAYHATCAAAAGVLVQQGEIPVFGEDGTEYKDWGIEFSCRFHRSKRDKKADGDSLGDDKRIIKAASGLNVGEVCQMQYLKGDIFAGAVVENRRSEETFLLDILPRGDRVEVEYKWLLIPDSSDYHLQKPSAKAIPMPKSFKDKESLNTSKRQVDDAPRAEDTFVAGCTWAEYKCEDIPRNFSQVKIDLAKENQMWFYLGKTSTEAKAQFTEDPKNQRHNPKGHFLDTIPKPAPSSLRQSYSASYPGSLSQNTAAVVKQQSRPVQPVASPSLSSSRSDKPYVYKPRSASEMYRIDAQSYRTQQNFLQKSAPYSFGTDPRYNSTLPTSSTNSYSTPSSVHTAPSPKLTMPQPASTPAAQPTPQAIAEPRAQTPQNAQPQFQSGPQSQARAQMAPQSQYRQPYVPAPSKASASRSSAMKVNPFAKYPYLQKEHNRSPLEYKSPYRPGGGFMNGYQGSLENHLRRQLFGSKKAPTSSLSNLSYASNIRPPYPPSTPSSSSQYSAGSAHGASPKQQPTPPSRPTTTSTPGPTPSALDRRDSGSLPHPAIDPKYNHLFQSFQPPSRPAPTQHQGPMMVPPVMYQYPQYHTSRMSTSQHQSCTQPQPQPPLLNQHHNVLQQARPSTFEPSQPLMRPPQMQYQPLPAASHPASYTNGNHGARQALYQQSPPANQQIYAQPQPQTLHQPIETQSSATTQAPSQQLTQNHSPSSTKPQVDHQQHQHANISPYQPSHPMSQSSQQESKPLYAHQKFFQKQQHPAQQPLEAGAGISKDFPDVPADHFSIIEKMMQNLKKAAPPTS